jgi:hypothetical protein
MLHEIANDYILNAHYPSQEKNLNIKIYELCWAYLLDYATPNEANILKEFFKL